MKKKLAVILAAALSLTCATTSSFKSEAANGTWSSDSSGWWYEEGGWYPAGQWYEIDGYWYYFLASGYMDYSEYRDGCWLNADGSWNTAYSGGYWASNDTGWWYTDASGWYPVSQWLWIDGSCYYFKDSGYMACNESVGGSWVGADGAWDPNHKDSGSGSGDSDDGSDDGDTHDNKGWKKCAYEELYHHTLASHKEYYDPDYDGGTLETYVNENKEEWEKEDGKWSVIYLDNDDIPELVNEHYEHGSYIIDVLAYNEAWDSYVEAWYNDYKDACYVEKTGLITWKNPNDVTGYYQDKTWGKDGKEIPLDDPYMYYSTFCWDFHNDQELFNIYYVNKEVYDSGKVRYYRRYENNSEVASYGYPKEGTEIEMSESEYNSFLNKNYKKLTDGLVLAENLLDKFK